MRRASVWVKACHTRSSCLMARSIPSSRSTDWNHTPSKASMLRAYVLTNSSSCSLDSFDQDIRFHFSAMTRQK